MYAKIFGIGYNLLMSGHIHKIRVGVVRGGVSPEYEVSLKTGAAALKNLSQINMFSLIFY